MNGNGMLAAGGVALLLSAASGAQPAPASVVAEIRGVREGQTLSGVASIQALITGVPASQVTFTLEGPRSLRHEERSSPYFFLGDDGQRALGWNTATVPDGEYVLTAVPSAQGADGLGRTVHFKVKNWIFYDDFNRPSGPELGPWSAPFGWELYQGYLRTLLGGYSAVQTVEQFPEQDFVIEAGLLGLGVVGGPMRSDNLYISFGGDPSTQLEYQVSYLAALHMLALTRTVLASNGELLTENLAIAPFSAELNIPYVLKVVRNAAGARMQVFLRQDSSPWGPPLLEAVDATYPTLAHLGVGVEREAPGDFRVNWIGAR